MEKVDCTWDRSFCQNDPPGIAFAVVTTDEIVEEGEEGGVEEDEEVDGDGGKGVGDQNGGTDRGKGHGIN